MIVSQWLPIHISGVQSQFQWSWIYMVCALWIYIYIIKKSITEDYIRVEEAQETFEWYCFCLLWDYKISIGVYTPVVCTNLPQTLSDDLE
jgi:hypothetical protein